jgi:hypothetical protein
MSEASMKEYAALNGTPNAECKLVRLLSEARSKILACLVLDRIGTLFSRQQAQTKRAARAVALFFVLEFILLVVITLLEGRELPAVILPVLLTSITTAFALYVFVDGFGPIVGQLEPILDDPSSEEHINAVIKDWLTKATSSPLQWFFPSLLTVLGLTALFILQHLPQPPFAISLSSYVALGLAALAVGHAGYWALVLPTIARQLYQLSARELKVFPLDPGRTPSLLATSRALGKSALLGAVVITLCMVTFFSLRPATTSTSTWSLFLLLVLGYLIASYEYFYPQFHFARIIQREKDHSIHELQATLSKYWARRDTLDNDDFARIDHLLALIKTLEGGKDTTIDFASLRSYLVSLLTPTLTYLGGTIDWTAVLQRLGLP